MSDGPEGRWIDLPLEERRRRLAVPTVIRSVSGGKSWGGASVTSQWMGTGQGSRHPGQDSASDCLGLHDAYTRTEE